MRHVVALTPLGEEIVKRSEHSATRYEESISKTQIFWNERTPHARWADPTKEFQILEFINKGAYGEIYLINDLRTGKEKVMLKKLTKSFYNKTIRRNEAERELAIMQRLPKHKNICQFYRFFQDEDYVYNILENCGNTTVWRHLIEICNGPDCIMTEQEARSIYKQILAALRVLHHNNIYHLDLTLWNFFYCPDTGIVKVGDYGFSVSTDEKIYPKFGCQHFYSPEKKISRHLRPSAVDIWYFGVGLFKVTTGKFPFGNAESMDDQNNMVKGIFDVPSHISPELRDLFSRVFRLEDDRITLSELSRHSWFSITS